MCTILACTMLTPVLLLTGCGSEKDDYYAKCNPIKFKKVK